MSMKVAIFFMEKSQEVRLSFDEGCEGTEYVTPLDSNLYRLDATPIFRGREVSFGDIIEAEVPTNGVLRFVELPCIPSGIIGIGSSAKISLSQLPFWLSSELLRNMVVFGNIRWAVYFSFISPQILTLILVLRLNR